MQVEYVESKSGGAYSVHQDNPHFLLGDEGSYCLLGAHHSTSTYHGVAFFDPTSGHMQKVLHRIAPREEVTRVRVFARRVELHTRSARFVYTWKNGVLCCAVQGEATVSLLADMRDLYDRSTFGREHTSSFSNSALTVQCRGNTALVLSDQNISPQNNWQPVDVSFDARRGESDDWWACEVGSARVQGRARFVVCPQSRAEQGYRTLSDEAFFNALFADSPPTSQADPRLVARELCAASLIELIAHSGDRTFLLAGFPWFFQHWSRDEMISLGGVRLLDPHVFSSIIMQASAHILPSGQLPNRWPDSAVGSADAFGWMCVQIVRALRDNVFSNEQVQTLADRVCRAVDARLSACDARGFLQNDAQETWMDTVGAVGDMRSGVRIEIQALFLASLQAASMLCQRAQREDPYQAHMDRVRSAVLAHLHTPGKLADGMVGDTVDWTVRPNALLCAYIFPPLLSREQWEKVFMQSLGSLEASWGGLATIEKKHPWFTAQHNAVQNASYHRGDVWYWVNNLVACAAAGTSDMLLPFAKRVLHASLHDLLAQGAAGRSSEISGFEQQEPFGCWSQLWSAATLLELLDALH